MYLPEWSRETELAGAQRYLDECAAPLRAAGQTVTTLAVAGPASVVGQAAAGIAATAEDEGAAMIAMATHGRGGLARLVLGSVATGVVQRARVPLLLVRPAAAERRVGRLSAAEVAGAVPATS